MNKYALGLILNLHLNIVVIFKVKLYFKIRDQN